MKISKINYDHLFSFLSKIEQQIPKGTSLNEIEVIAIADEDDYLFSFSAVSLSFGWFITDRGPVEVKPDNCKEYRSSLGKLLENLEIEKPFS